MVKWLLLADFPSLPVYTGITPGHLYRDDQTPSQSHLLILKTWEGAPKIKGLAALVHIKDATYRYWGKQQRGAETRQSVRETTAWEALGNNAAPLFAERFRGQRSVCLESPRSLKGKVQTDEEWAGGRTTHLLLLQGMTETPLISRTGSGANAEWSCGALITDTEIRCITHFGISINPIMCVFES